MLTRNNSASSSAAARRYYDSADVNGFYTAVWGGESIHIGIYTDEREEITTACRRTTERVADKVIAHLGPGRTVLDLGSGYGRPARYLASRFGCRVVALNISHVQNRRHRETTIASGADELSTVITGSFEDIPCAGGQFDLVWSQEALSHAASPSRALAEAVRVLKPNGQLIFTDLLAADDAPADVLRPIVSRTAAETLPTHSFYQRTLVDLGFVRVEFDDLSEHLLTHYRRINEQTRLRRPELVNSVSPAYVDHLLENLPLWTNACQIGLLRWGIFHCDSRPNSSEPDRDSLPPVPTRDAEATTAHAYRLSSRSSLC